MSAKVAPNGVTRQAVLDYLIREADLDGLVTVREREISESLGVTQAIVGRHIHNLAADGALSIMPSGYGRMNSIQLAESVTS